MTLAGKVALVINAATSFGYTVARKLGAAGAQIIISDADSTGLQHSLDGLKGADIKGVGICTDLANLEQRNALFEQIKAENDGRLDILVFGHKPNWIKGDFMEHTAEDFTQMYSKYLTTPFLTCKSALPLLEKSKAASIILVSSIAGFTPFNDIALYSSAQTAVLGLTKTLAQSLASRHIRVNSICTGMFEDDGTGASWSSCSGTQSNPESVEKMRSALANLIPLGRTARATDCAGLVEFLASDQACYITGENVTLSGGISVRI